MYIFKIDIYIFNNESLLTYLLAHVKSERKNMATLNFENKVPQIVTKCTIRTACLFAHGSRVRVKANVLSLCIWYMVSVYSFA